MTPDQVIGLAKLAGFYDGRDGLFWGDAIQLQRFYELARNATLEEAAIKSWSCGMEWHMKRNTSDVREVGSAIAAEIRSLKK